MYCNNCGKANPEGSKFCQHCGSKISLNSTVSAQNKHKSSHTATWIVGFCSIPVLLGGFIFGYQYGFSKGSSSGYDLGFKSAQVPTAQDAQRQEQAKQAMNDIGIVIADYKQMSDLCEQKYQYGLNGDFNSAFQVKGQMTALQGQIDQIIGKYNYPSVTPQASY